MNYILNIQESIAPTASNVLLVRPHHDFDSATWTFETLKPWIHASQHPDGNVAPSLQSKQPPGRRGFSHLQAAGLCTQAQTYV